MKADEYESRLIFLFNFESQEIFIIEMVASWKHFITLLRDNDVILVVSSNCTSIISNFSCDIYIRLGPSSLIWIPPKWSDYLGTSPKLSSKPRM